MNMITNKKGFSLVEIMFALVLIVGIMATMFTKLRPQQRKGKVNQAKLAIASLERALDMFYMDCSYYPSESEGLEALVSAPDKCESWGPEPYLKNGKIPKDPWNNEFVYQESDDGDFEIISLGEDGEEGGKNYAKDISSKDI